MNRRAFLRSGVAAASATMLGPGIRALGSATAATPPGSILDLPAASSPVDTIVVLMMENRSFDHYFGWLATDEAYLEAGRSRYGAHFAVDGLLDQSFTKPDGTVVSTYHLPSREGEPNPYRGCGNHPDPGHGWDSGRAQRDRGFVSDGSGNDEYAIGYYLEEDLPTYGQLARNFTVFDRYHCSLLAGTYGNRWYMHGAQSNGSREGYIPIEELGLDWPTIWDRLVAARVPCGYYGVDLPVIAFWGARMLPLTHSIAQFFLDCQLGRLPRVVFVDPGFMSGMRTDDHPHGDMRLAQGFVASIVRAFMASPHWDRGAMFVNYDEWGGFFDHVRPPVLADDRASADDLENFGQTGFRLPVMLLSPYARPGYVDHRLYDHTSILRFIEWRYLGAPAEGPGGEGWWLTERDHNANNIGATLTATPVNEHGIQQSVVPAVVSRPCHSQFFQDVPGLVDAEDQLLAPALGLAGLHLDELPSVEVSATSHQLSVAYDLGMFDRFGFSTEPSMSLDELLAAG